MDLDYALIRLTITEFSEIVDQEKLKNIYRELVKKHHPDKGGDKEIFQEIQDAYKLLSKGNVVLKPTDSEKAKEAPPTTDYKPGNVIITVAAEEADLEKGFLYKVTYFRNKLLNPSQVVREKVGVEVLINKQLMGSTDQIIYKGYGDQLVVKGDLIINIITLY